jgi:hypothetical protein
MCSHTAAGFRKRPWLESWPENYLCGQVGERNTCVGSLLNLNLWLQVKTFGKISKTFEEVTWIQFPRNADQGITSHHCKDRTCFTVQCFGLVYSDWLSVFTPLSGVGKRIRCDSNEAFFWMMCVTVCTSTYQYVPVRTNMYCDFLNFALLEIWRHHIVSLAWKLVVFNSQSTAWVCEQTTCPFKRTYSYVPVCTAMYWRVILVLPCTGTYQYVLVHTITYNFAWTCPGV